MSTKNRPDPNGYYERALMDEPMFVLLARDPSAPSTVSGWALDRMRHISCGERPETDMPQVEGALQLATEMQQWRRANQGTPAIGDIEAIPPRWKREASPALSSLPENDIRLARRELALLDYIYEQVDRRRAKATSEDLVWVCMSLLNLQNNIYEKFPSLKFQETADVA